MTNLLRFIAFFLMFESMRDLKKTSRRIMWGDRYATISPRKSGKYQINWKQDGVWRNTTVADEERAENKARTILKSLGSDDYQSKVTHQEARAIQVIRENLGVRNILEIAEIVSRMLLQTKGILELEKIVTELERMSNLKNTSMADAFEVYKSSYVDNPDISSQTWKTPRVELNNFMATYPGLNLNDVSVELLLSWLKRSDVGAVTFNNRRSVWRTFFNRAMKREEIDYNPTDKIDKRPEPKKHPVILSPDVAQKCVDFLATQEDNHLLFGFAVAAFAGMRPSEIQRLRPEHIDLKSGYINADEHVCRKLRQARYVPIHPVLKKILKKMTFEEGRTITSPRRWKYISQRLRETKIITVWHEDVLRHSYISYRNAVIQNVNKIADECGNSAEVIKTNYRRPITKKQGNKWFAIRVGSL